MADPADLTTGCESGRHCSFGAVRAICVMIVAGCSILLYACERGSEPASTTRAVDDPAMAVVESESAGTTEPSDPAAVTERSLTDRADTSTAALPEESTVDLANRRVFLAGRGWLSAEEFTLIYNERPEILPDDLDLEAAHRLLQQESEH